MANLVGAKHLATQGGEEAGDVGLAGGEAAGEADGCLELALEAPLHGIDRRELGLAGQEIAVVEAAILIETGRFRRFDRLILTVCPPEMQLERYIARTGGTEAEALARLSRQMSLDEKRRYAHFLIDTSGSHEDTGRQVREVFEQLQQVVV